MDKKQTDLFLDYGELIVKYNFSSDTFNRAHSTSQNHINSVNSYHFSLDQIKDSHTKAIKQYLAARKDGTEWSMDKITRLMLRNLGATEVNPHIVADLYKLNDHDFELLPNVDTVLRDLRIRYSLGIISNLPHDSLITELETLGLRTLFETITISGQIGYRKPRPEIYQEAMRRAKTNSQNSIFVSHDQEEVEGAKKVGIRGILVKSLEEVLGIL